MSYVPYDLGLPVDFYNNVTTDIGNALPTGAIILAFIFGILLVIYLVKSFM